MTLFAWFIAWLIVSVPLALVFGRLLGVNDEGWKTPPPPLGDNVVRGPWRPRVLPPVDGPVDAGWDWPTHGDAA